MSKDREQNIGIKEKLLLAVPKKEVIIRSGIENILKSTTIEYPYGFTEAVQDLALDGCAFELATNHTSHADAFAAAKAGKEIKTAINLVLPEKDRIKGAIMPFALSMQQGTQTRLLNEIFAVLRPFLENELGTTPIFTATENDISQNRVDGANPVSFTRLMIQSVKDNKMIVIFPEGRVEGGRLDDNGRLKGMQEFRDGALQQSLRVSVSEKNRVAIIPAGVSGGHKVYDPQRKSLPKDTFLVGLGVSSKPIFEVKVGMPIVFEKREVKNIDSKTFDKLIGAGIANLLPPQMRGVYA